jgi:xanthine phosphoribosyltransferase
MILLELLRQRILESGKALSQHILLVDSFLNHQVDVDLMRKIGEEFARLFKDTGATRVMTIESSGIVPASMTALAMGLPLVVMKKSTSSILSEDILQTSVFSFTKGSNYQLTLKTKFIERGDKVLFIDDFLAYGEAAKGACKLIELAGATVAGVGIVIEKAFQPGHSLLEQAGYPVTALASIKRLDYGTIEFMED